MQFLKTFFVWWHSRTFGTALTTFLRGRLVGADAQGNRYYEDKKGASVNGTHPRRWVIYNGDVEASRVPPEWHGWLHYTVNETPIENPPRKQAWQKPHQVNLTGTTGAHKPNIQSGSQTVGYGRWQPKEEK